MGLENVISLPSAELFNIFGVSISNSVFTSFVISALIIVFAVLVRKNAGVVPSKLQLAFEMVLAQFYDALKSAYGSEKKAKRHLPYILTIFLFITVANQFTLIPLVGSIDIGGEHLFRLPTTDWSFPIALALVTVISAQILAFSIAPIKHIGNYINVKSFLKVKSPGDLFFAFIDFYLGLLDIIGEFAKVISLSARLFGNVLAGEAMVLIISALTMIPLGALNIPVPFAPVPFVALSIFSGFIQAFVFAFLSLQFISITLSSVSSDKEETQAEPQPA